eukprot:Pgem_evm1s1562
MMCIPYTLSKQVNYGEKCDVKHDVKYVVKYAVKYAVKYDIKHDIKYTLYRGGLNNTSIKENRSFLFIYNSIVMYTSLSLSLLQIITNT